MKQKQFENLGDALVDFFRSAASQRQVVLSKIKPHQKEIISIYILYIFINNNLIYLYIFYSNWYITLINYRFLIAIKLGGSGQDNS